MELWAGPGYDFKFNGTITAPVHENYYDSYNLCSPTLKSKLTGDASNKIKKI